VRFLIIGGTVFLGRALAAAALDAGHDLTLFNRGTREVDFGAPVEQLRGDRTRDLGALEGRRFDAVVDTSGYAPSARPTARSRRCARRRCRRPSPPAR
jgi:2'-hydroxyisoflavone reductase